jgi:DNA-binding LacI/PurR family transcriptional regulator
MAKAVKLADVARAAGVSQGTASNVFSRPELVRPEVRARVEEWAGKLGYRGPDPRGRLLRAGKVNAIGVVVGDDLTYFFNDPFNREFMIGLAAACDERGAGVSLISAANRATAAWNVETALVDGFIVQCMEDGDRLVELAKKRGLPFVACDIDPGAGTSSVRIDDQAGARMAAEHLLALGHKRFAILSLELRADGRTGFVDRERLAAADYAGTRARLAGYGAALAAAGIPADAVPVIELVNDRAGAAEGAATLLDHVPEATAVLAMSDVAALGLLGEAAARGIAVPDRLSIVGFDDVPEAAAADPPLTTIRQPIREKGRRAGSLILDGGEPRHELLPVELVVRGTTAPPRA